MKNKPERKLFFKKEILPENIGELVLLAVASGAEIVVFLVSKINITLLEPMN
ncbi:hypothetical protein [Helicobacter sp. 11S03491-1]|uniref:hypothetical protein n=1 Tax=Helicobacter sp. 11S03491-1 TaxID=1476196 RepID=UPI0015DA1680|nr:hypothetical protein [Helicobacter sp. 11S03491-1]